MSPPEQKVTANSSMSSNSLSSFIFEERTNLLDGQQSLLTFQLPLLDHPLASTSFLVDSEYSILGELQGTEAQRHSSCLVCLVYDH